MREDTRKHITILLGVWGTFLLAVIIAYLIYRGLLMLSLECGGGYVGLWGLGILIHHGSKSYHIHRMNALERALQHEELVQRRHETTRLLQSSSVSEYETTLHSIEVERAKIALRREHVEVELLARNLLLLPADDNGNYPIHLQAGGLTPLRFDTGNSPYVDTSKTRVREERTPAPSQKLLASPVPTTAILLRDELLLPFESESIQGYGMNSGDEQKIGKWGLDFSMLVVGESGSGKTQTVVYDILVGLLHGARLLIIDPDAEKAQSLTKRLGDAAKWDYGCMVSPVAYNAVTAMRVIERANELVNSGEYRPAILVIEEYTTIMNNAEQGLYGWDEVIEPLNALIETWANVGRKLNKKTIVIGQNAKNDRLPTNIRNVFTSTYAHRMREDFVPLLFKGDKDARSLIPRLANGEVYVRPTGSPTRYTMHIPHTVEDDINFVVDVMQELRENGDIDRLIAQFFPRETSTTSLEGEAFLQALEGTGTPAPSSMNAREHHENTTRTPHERATNDVERVELDNTGVLVGSRESRKQALRELIESGETAKSKLIPQVYMRLEKGKPVPVTKGGSEAYKLASQEYDELVEEIVASGRIISLDERRA